MESKAAEVKQGASRRDRLFLIQTISALPPAQLDQLCFALDPPKAVIPSNAATSGDRSKALLDWAEGPTGPGLMAIDEVLQELIPKAITPQQAIEPKAFAISGRIGDLSPAELQAIVELIRKKTGDDSIELAFSEEGSIKLILNGTSEGLEKLQELFDSGKLTAVLDDRCIEYVKSTDSDTTEARKARLIQTLRLRQQYRTPSTTLAQDLSHAIDSVSARVRTIANGMELLMAYANIHNGASYLITTRARARDLTTALVNVRNSARGFATALTKVRNSTSIDHDRIRIYDIMNVRDRALSFAVALDHVRYFVSNRANTLTFDRIRDLTKTLDRIRGLTNTLDLDLTSTLDRARDCAHNIMSIPDLIDADLNGANLRGLDLREINLEGADLSNADVTDTLFGSNPGLTESDKRDLQSRGAIL